MNWITIMAMTDRKEVLPALRMCLPEVGIAEIRRRLKQGDVLVERELFTNDWEEVNPLLRRILAVLQSHDVPFKIYERSGPSTVAPSERERIDDEVLENILSASERRRGA